MASRLSREECWASRDAYFRCCAEHNEERKECLGEKEIFDQKCLPSWVKHFEILRFGPGFDAERVSGGGAGYFKQSVHTGRRDPEAPAATVGGTRV